jgi:sialate O-acetylesterase
MKIDTGLFNHMVLQRNSKNVSEAGFSGHCAASGPLTATVRLGKKTVKGFANATVGSAARGNMQGTLKGLPVGGPYEIELNAGEETLTIKDVLVGDVWLLGGQSNMQGCALFPKSRLAADPLVRAFFMDDRWATAKDTIHNMWECVDQVHVDICGGKRPAKPDADWGVCPGPAFGNELSRLTRIPQGLIACAHGGTSMSQWDPKRKNENGKSLYGAMIRRLKKNGGRVAGLIWYQGCSDANPDTAPLYTARMKEFAASLRRDSGDKALPIVIVQIARVIGWGAGTAPHWNSIQDQEHRLPSVIKQLATVPAIDLPLDDTIHLSGAGQYVLGVRMAQAMQVLREGRKAGLPQIAVKKVTIETVRGLGVAVVEFENVVGRLCSGSRPSGFAIVNQSGSANHFDIQLDGSCARIRSGMSPDDMAQAMLHYGYGTDPYCNITDEAGRSLPVFGPLRMGVPRAITPFIRQVRVSAFQPSAGTLGQLGCPASLDALQMTPRTFTEPFCNLHPEIMQHGNRDELVYFAFRFSCKAPLPLALILGYDGPVKAWVDGKPLMHDPNGTNPATTDKLTSRFKATAGEHEIVVALGTNHGAAWGVFLQLERFGLTKAQLLKGPESYMMPEILE